jgi:beta-glucosidase
VSRFSFDAIVSYRDWIETFQPAFKACGEAGAMSYMCSYNSINGVPACANRELLGDLLRGEWNFTGFVVSDCVYVCLCRCYWKCIFTAQIC